MKYRNKNNDYVLHNIKYIDNIDNGAANLIDLKNNHQNHELFNKKVDILENDIKDLKLSIAKLRKEKFNHKNKENNEKQIAQSTKTNYAPNNDDNVSLEQILDNLYENYDYTKKIEAKLKREVFINKKLHEILKNKKNNYNDENKYYNDEWDYDFEQYFGDDDMNNKHEYYSGELPKTKIVKIRTHEGVVSYTKKDIERFVAEEGRKIALEEIEKIIANNVNNNLHNEQTNSNNINNFANDFNDNIVSNNTLWLIKNLYESRITALENAIFNKNNESQISSKIEEIKKQQLNATIPMISPIKKSVFIGKDKHKRKQKHFFEIKEHSSPKLKKSDIERK